MIKKKTAKIMKQLENKNITLEIFRIFLVIMRFDILSKRSICYTIFWCALVVLTGIHIDVRKKNPLVVAIISLLHLIVPWKPWKPLRELL